jgi:hypothetical protein
LREPTISACLIVKNEATVLERCLRSLESVVDEIVVVDTGSTDASSAIAGRCGARVLRHPWQHDFSAARNASLDAATCDWLLVIDADEYLAPADQRLVRATIRGADADGLWLTQRNFQRPGELLQFVECRIVRMFRRRPDIRYTGIIHEEVTTAIARAGGRIGGTNIVIMHDGYMSETAQGTGTRAARNLPLLLRAAAAAPQDPYWQFQLGATYQPIGRTQDARRHLQQVFQLPHAELSTEVRSGAAIRLAQIALGERRHGSVVHYAELALRHEPQDVLAHYLAGLALIRLGRCVEAHAHLAIVKASGRAGLSTAADLDALLTHCLSRAAASPDGRADSVSAAGG